MTSSAARHKSPVVYFVLVFVLSLPFWIIGAMQEAWLPKSITINLPISALMFLGPGIAASILIYREQHWAGVRRLWKRGITYRINKPIWYLPAIFLMPLLMLIEYGVLRRIGIALPSFQFPVLALPIFLAIFLLSGICEEVGWSGYVTDPLQQRWGALAAGVIIGAIWGIWHSIPYLQADNAPSWVFWQVMSTIGNRVLTIWLYNNTAKSIFTASVFHAMYNISFLVLFPIYGSYYNPFITTILDAVLVVIVVGLWGARTLARFRYANGVYGESQQ